MPTESEFKTKIAKQMRDDGGYGRRFEDQYAVGLPDMLLIPKGGPVFMCEAKIIRLANGDFYPTPRQFEELKRIRDAEAGVIPILMGICPITAELYICPMAQLTNKKSALVRGTVKQISESLYMFARLTRGKPLATGDE